MATIKRKQKNGYLGNERLRAAGTVIDLEQWQLDEIRKCRKDYVYFTENYFHISSLDDGEILFKMWPPQKEFMDTIHNNRRVISMQSRQLGKTSVLSAYVTWRALFKPTRTIEQIALLANKAAAAREILSRVQFAYERFPLWLQVGIRTFNKGDIFLENGSKIFTAATSKQGVRGRSCSLVAVDEAAIVQNQIAEEFFTAMQPIISSGKRTKFILTSTPLGFNHFYHRWQAADKWDTKEKGTNGFIQHFVHWSQIPGRTQEWADAEKKAIGALKFTQEYDCKFLGSSLTLLDPNIIGSLKASTPIIENQEGLRIFTPPVQMVRDSNGKVTQVPHLYFGIVDVSRGIGGDYSALTIIDVSVNPYKVVATYRNNLVSPLLFPTIIAKLGYDYNEAFLLVEINENGQQIADILYDELEYENLLTVVKNGTRGQVLSSGFGRNTGCQIGVKTSTTVKRLGCLAIKTLIEEHKLSPEDSNIINEFTTFIQVRKSYEADQGYHDDMVMTLVLFGWLTTQQFFKDLTNEDLRDSIFKNRITSINQNLTPYIFVSQKEPEVIVEDYGNRMYIEESTDIDDIRWLLGM